MKDYNIPHSPMDKYSRQELNSEKMELKIFILKCIFFTASHGTFFKVKHMLRHKENFNRYKVIEINLVFYKTTIS